MSVRVPARSVPPAQAGGAARRTSRLLGAAGFLGVLGGMSCAVSMVLPLVGLVGLAGAGTAAGSEAGTMAGMRSGPPPGGVLGLLTRAGPELLAVSALLVVVSVALRRRAAAPLAVIGGAVLYWGMYLQSSGAVMYATLVGGFAIWLAMWAWARSGAPSDSCPPLGRAA